MVRIKKLATTINTGLFANYQISQQVLVEETFKGLSNEYSLSEQQKIDAVNSACKKLVESSYNSASVKNDQRYSCVTIVNYKGFRRVEEDDIIYNINYLNGNYYLSSGLYCGVINFSENLPQLEIRTGYSDVLFKRILNFCCGVYADSNTTKKTSAEESIYSLLIQYLFLISLRKVAAQAIPKRYVRFNCRGYNIRGNVDINTYVNNDLLTFDKKITHYYSEQLEIQSIIDVLYYALRNCKINKKDADLPFLNNYERYLASLYSGKRPSMRTINSIGKETCLNSSLYSEYKLPLNYAQILLNNKDLNSGGEKTLAGVSGFLVDASFLWEMYLYNLMRLNLENWDIEAQCEISMYGNTFFAKNNYPDFVLRNKYTGKIFVLDAKFKRMNFRCKDVDNDDIRQLHSYSYYFALREGTKFVGAALIYPSKDKRPENIKNTDYIYGIKDSGARFGVFSIKDPSGEETITNNEATFIKELKTFLDDESSSVKSPK